MAEGEANAKKPRKKKIKQTKQYLPFMVLNTPIIFFFVKKCTFQKF